MEKFKSALGISLYIMSMTAWAQPWCNFISHGDFEDAAGALPDPWVLTTDGGASSSIVVDFGYDNVTGANDFGGHSLLLQNPVTSNINGSVTISQNITVAAYTLYHFDMAFYSDTGGSTITCSGIPVVYTIPGLDALPLLQVSVTALSRWTYNSTAFVPYVNGLWQVSCQTTLRPGSNARLDDILIRPGHNASCASNVTRYIRGYNFMSCQTANGNFMSRPLGEARTSSINMTLEQCAIFCSPWSFFGTQNSKDCYCGNSVDGGSIVVGPEHCSAPCASDQKELCGATDFLSLYYKPPPTAPSEPTELTPPGPSVGKSIGCYNDTASTPGNPRTLDDSHVWNPDNMTIEICATFCATSDYFGLEYGFEWYVSCPPPPPPGSLLWTCSRAVPLPITKRTVW